MSTRFVRAGMAGILVVTLAATGCGSSFLGSDQLGDDVFAQTSSYGWGGSFAVGYRLTDGVTIVRIDKGPVTIKSIEPVMHGGSTRLLGAQVRLLTASRGSPVVDSEGWPPTHRDLDGAEDAAGFVIPDPGAVDPVDHPHGTVHIEILLGYEFVGEGRAVRRGVNVKYETGGRQRKVFLGSYMAVCAPAAVPCQHEDENGPVPLAAHVTQVGIGYL
ncbi:hypothetical protein ABZ738_02055 [Micromonospora sp. NPDC047793]|uniref:hypothetical protein n=1 Tax=unclassified Micromonospora TaxID=2617518 RepID=UPI0010347BCB|nr:hypothetical protein [Verrucosispora sp. SN26_14.1]TBL38058.1 hypothetical protein EYA84_10215 [Verrucosispora sp. SN26_14.1]